jgi:4-hydroxyphenylpyruvate dioxygenase-like putative hemolysin
MASLMTTTGSIAVIGAPHANGDQLGRFVNERGGYAIHHIAVSVENIVVSGRSFEAMGFKPISPIAEDGEIAQQFLKNGANQVLELIHRKGHDSRTFTCSNIAALRRSEEA